MPLYPIPMRQMAVSYRVISVTRRHPSPHRHAANRIVIRCAPQALEQSCYAAADRIRRVLPLLIGKDSSSSHRERDTSSQRFSDRPTITNFSDLEGTIDDFQRQ